MNDNILDGEGADQDDDEHPVVEELSKHVILSLAQLARVDLVEELHEDEGLEDDGVNLNLTSGLLKLPSGLLGVSVELLLGGVEGPALLVLNSEDISAFEHEDEKNDDLEDGLSKDVSPHDGVDDGIVLLLRLTVKDHLSVRRLSSEGKGGESVHDQVDPEHLGGSERRLAEHAGTGKDDEHSNNVDGKLELEELANTVEDVTSVNNTDQDGAEVVVHKLDITGVLGNISASNSHGETNIGSVKGGGIVGTVTSDSDSTAKTDETIDK